MNWIDCRNPPNRKWYLSSPRPNQRSPTIDEQSNRKIPIEMCRSFSASLSSLSLSLLRPITAAAYVCAQLIHGIQIYSNGFGFNFNLPEYVFSRPFLRLYMIAIWPNVLNARHRFPKATADIIINSRKFEMKLCEKCRATDDARSDGHVHWNWFFVSSNQIIAHLNQ